MKLKMKKRNQPKRPMKERIRRMFGSRFRAGSYSAFAAVIVIAIAVIVNMIAGSLPTTATQLDMTSQSLYSLSDQTKRIAASLDKDVNLYLLTVFGNEDDTIVRLLERYEGLSDHIRVSHVDPNAQPTFLDAYELDITQLYTNSVLVECGEKYRLVSYADIYVTSYTMDSYSYYGYSTTTEFDGENALTNAIHYVTSDNLPKVYTLTGHGEKELDYTITDMLEQDNMEYESLSLLSLESVPEDAGTIIIHVPSSDLSADEAQMLISWMEGGGSIVLISDYIDEGAMPNLLSVTESMGLTAETGLIIEGDNRMHLSRYPYYLLPDLESHETTDALISGGYYILMPLSQGLAGTGDSEATVTYLLSTSDNAYTKAAGIDAETTEKEEVDAEGVFHPAAVSEKNGAKLAWFSSAEMLNESIDMMVSGANSNLFMNAVNWMCGQEETISIRAKSMDSTTLTVTGSQSSFWSIIMIGLIPAAFIGVGIWVCVRRKKR